MAATGGSAGVTVGRSTQPPSTLSVRRSRRQMSRPSFSLASWLRWCTRKQREQVNSSAWRGRTRTVSSSSDRSAPGSSRFSASSTSSTSTLERGLVRAPCLELLEGVLVELVVGLARGVVVGGHRRPPVLRRLRSVQVLRRRRLVPSVRSSTTDRPSEDLLGGRVADVPGCAPPADDIGTADPPLRRERPVRGMGHTRRAPSAGRTRAVPRRTTMPVYALGDRVPHIHPTAFVHPDAVVIGDVTVGAGVDRLADRRAARRPRRRSWSARRTSVQDGTVVHCTGDAPHGDRRPLRGRATTPTSRAARSRTTASSGPGSWCCTGSSYAPALSSAPGRSCRNDTEVPRARWPSASPPGSATTPWPTAPFAVSRRGVRPQRPLVPRRPRAPRLTRRSTEGRLDRIRRMKARNVAFYALQASFSDNQGSVARRRGARRAGRAAGGTGAGRRPAISSSPAGAPRSPSTRAPASVATRPPAARSHACGPRS